MGTKNAYAISPVHIQQHNAKAIIVHPRISKEYDICSRNAAAFMVICKTVIAIHIRGIVMRLQIATKTSCTIVR